MDTRPASDLDTTLALADSLGQAMLVVDASGEVVLVSRRLTELAPFGPEPLLGRTTTDLNWGEHLDRDGAPLPRDRWPITRTLRDGARIDGEAVGFRCGEEITWITLSSLPVPDRRRPERRAAMVLVGSIVRQRGTSLHLVDQQHVLAAAFDAAPTPMLVARHDGHVVRSNLAFDRDYRATGPWWDVVDEPDRAELRAELAALQSRPGAPLRLDCRARRRDGTPVLVQIAATVLPGLATQVSVQLTDITALRRSEERFRTLSEIVPVGIFEVDAEGTFTSVSPLVSEITGRQDLVGEPVLRCIHPDEHERTTELFKQVMRGEVYSTEQRLATADGGELVVLTAGRPLRDPAGEIVGVLGTVVDLTDHLLQQARLRELGNEVELLAAQQARSRLEAQLAQAQRFETLGRLAGGVAHDFNNLLGVISNYAGFLAKRSDLPAELRGDVEQIAEATRRGGELTRQLLLFARREQLHPQRFDLSRVLGELGALMTRPLRPRIALTIDAERGTEVVADQGQIEQMVLNLLINARDALPDGGHITVTARPAPAPDDSVVLTVSDDGIGMAPEVQDRVFEPFFTTKPRSEASGLGLATVQGIVEQAGGTVAIESAPGRGTTVTVRLPTPADG